MIGKIVKLKLLHGFAYFKVIQEYNKNICYCECIKGYFFIPYKYLFGAYYNIYKDYLIEITQEEFDKIMVFE